MRNPVLKQVQDAIRHPCCFPGGYEKAIYMSDGGRLCRKCVLENYRQIAEATVTESRNGWAIAGVDVHWEGPSENCDNCGHQFESEYGDPEASDED